MSHKPKNQATVHYMLAHFNLTDEELDALLPWSYENRPPFMHESAKWRYVSRGAEGPRVHAVEGTLLTFEDGSRYRIATGWEVGEVFLPQ